MAILEELLFRACIQYFSFLLILFFLTRRLTCEGKPINSTLSIIIASAVSILISVTVFMLFHNSYLKNSVQVSSAMYSVTFITYLLGGIVSAIIMNRTSNLWLAIFFHAAWNALQFISTALLVSNYQIIITFLGTVLLSNGVAKETVDNIAHLIISIVS